jgi:hypothetical protein
MATSFNTSASGGTFGRDPGGGSSGIPTGLSFIPVPSTNINIGKATQAIEDAQTQITSLIDESREFTDVETLAQPFTEAFEQFSSTAEEVFLQEVRAAEDDLGAFINNNPDVRGAVNLTVARQIKGDIFNATLEAASSVQDKLAQGIFAAEQLASQNFAQISSTVAQATTQLAGVTADFVASLTATQAQVYSANLNYAANLAQISANRDIASLNAATTQRGQDIQFDIAQLQADTQLELADLEAASRLSAAQLASPQRPQGITPVTPPTPQQAASPTAVQNLRPATTGSSINPIAIDRDLR